MAARFNSGCDWIGGTYVCGKPNAQAQPVAATPQVQSLSLGGMAGLGAGGAAGGGGLGLPTPDVSQYRDIADPFWQQRGQYQTQLANLMSNPGAMTTSPMYQFALDQGMNAVNRTAAAQHMLGSGNRLADLTKFGQGLASQQFFPMASLLSNLAGVNSSNPAAALSGLVQSRGQDVNAATDLYKTNAQLAIGLGDTTLGRDKFNYQVNQDALSNAAAQKALSDFQTQQAYNKLYSGYSFG